MNCQDMIYSNDYADYIIDIASPRGRELLEQAQCRVPINQEYGVIQVERSEVAQDMRDFLNFQNLPRVFGLLDTGHLKAAGVLQLQRNPELDLFGQNTILGILDTGIDYTHPAFINEDGTSRIGVIWDQTIPSQQPWEEFPYGSIYDREQINEALRMENPYEIVPSVDTEGHGTFLAGVAAGRGIPEEDFQGVAPLCDIAVVKLKGAKEYLRNFWLIPENVTAFQETDIFLGIRFIQAYAYQQKKPFVILLGCGTNTGNHGKSDYLKNYLNNISTFSGKCVVLAAGNEGSLGHHYRGNGLENWEYQDVELNVGEGERGFSVELWAEVPDVYTVGFRAPNGEITGKIPLSLVQEGVEVGFSLEETRITVFYETVERTSGEELIWMRFDRPTPGIWNIRIYKENVLAGRFDLWLPMERFIRAETYFLKPDPYTTICEPGNADNVITVTAYDDRTDGLFFQASRGYSRDLAVKPDFAAPGVEVFGTAFRNGFRRETGTSVAAAVAAGCALLLFSDRGYYTGLQIKNVLIKGTNRKNITYPNRDFGYGYLNIAKSVESLGIRRNRSLL